MKELNLPHKEPINFAKYVISKEDNIAVVRVKFDDIPTLPMIVESAAQSSGAFSDGEKKMGFLAALKNIKLLEGLNSLEYDVQVIYEHQLESLTYFNFEVKDKELLVATGVFVIAMQ